MGITELTMYLGAHFAVPVSQVDQRGTARPYLAPGALLTLNLRPEKLIVAKA